MASAEIAISPMFSVRRIFRSAVTDASVERDVRSRSRSGRSWSRSHRKQVRSKNHAGPSAR